MQNYRFFIPLLKHIKQYRHMSLVELVSLYTVPLSTINGLTRTSNGHGRLIQKFSNRPITFESNRIRTANSNSNRISKLRRSLSFSHTVHEYWIFDSRVSRTGKTADTDISTWTTAQRHWLADRQQTMWPEWNLTKMMIICRQSARWTAAVRRSIHRRSFHWFQLNH